MSTLRSRVSPDAWALLAIAGAVLLANAPYLLGVADPNPLGPTSGLLSASHPGYLGGLPALDPNYGFTSQALGHRAALDVLRGHMPWWNPYETTGLPLAGEMQSAAMFPPTLLTAFSNGQIFEHMLLELLAGGSTFLLLRRLAIGRPAAVLAGMAFALNGTFAFFSHAAVNPVALAPLLLLGLEQAYAAVVAGRRGGWWLIAVAGALSVYAGFPEVAYIDALLALAWLMWRFGCLGRSRARLLAAKAAAGGLAGALLAAPLLVAFVGYLQHSEVALHGGAYYRGVHLPAAALPHLLLPYVHGPGLRYTDPGLVLPGIWGNSGGYVTSSLLLCSLLGVASSRRRGLKLTLLLWTVLAISRMYGVPVVGDVLGVLPGMDQVLFARYAFASVELPIAILAGLGLNDLLSAAPGSRRRLFWSAAAALVAVAAAALAAKPLADQLGPLFRQRPYFLGSIAWGAMAVVAIAAVALLRSYRTRVLLITALVAGDAAGLFIIPMLSAPSNVRTDLAPVAYLQRHLGRSRFFTLGPVQPNYGSYFGIASLNVNDVPLSSAFARYVHQRLDGWVDPTHLVGTEEGGRPAFAPSTRAELLKNLEGYRAAGVAYVLTKPGQPLPESPATFTQVLRSPTTWIYRLAGSAPYFTATDPRCTVRSSTRQVATLTCPGRATLVRHETALPGWSARVDDAAAEIRPHADLFQSVSVDAGTHRVAFSYSPPAIGWGYLAFAGGCIWLLLGAFRRRRTPG